MSVVVKVRKGHGPNIQEIDADPFRPQRGSGILAVLEKDFGAGKLFDDAGFRVTPDIHVDAGEYMYIVTVASTAGATRAAAPRRQFHLADAIHPKSLSYYLEPEELPWYVDSILGNNGYLVVCDGRQAGKSTLAYALAEALCKENVTVYHVEFGTDTALHTTSEKFWAHMRELHTQASAHTPGRFKAFDSNTMRSFAAAVSSATTEEVYLYDEVSAVPLEVFNDFMEAARLTKNKGSKVLGMVLFGVHTIKHRMDAYNSMLVDEACDAMDVEFNEEGALQLTSNSSRFMGLQLLISPFRESWVLAVARFTQQHIALLIAMWRGDHQQSGVASGAACLEAAAVPDVARSVLQLTAGMKGLVCFCLYHLTQDVYSIKTAADWEEFVDTSLVDKLVSHAVFDRVRQVLRKVFPSRQQENQLKRSNKASAIRLQQQVICQAVYSTSVRVTPDIMPHLHELFAEGLLVVCASARHTGVQLLVRPELEPFLVIQLAAPVLRDCFIKKMAMLIVTKETRPEGELCMLWVLFVVVRNLDLNCLRAIQQALASGNTSEYGYEFQAYLLLYSALKMYYASTLELVAEARSASDPVTGRMRLDLLWRYDDRAYGMELLAHGTPTSIDEHAKRACKYSTQHKTDAGPAHILVVNFCEKPQNKWASYTPYYSSHERSTVQVVHVVICKETEKARVLVRGKEAQDIEIDKMCVLSGVQRVYRRSQGG